MRMDRRHRGRSPAGAVEVGLLERNIKLENSVSHTVHGRLRGGLCGDRDEPLAGIVVRLYSVGGAGDGGSDGKSGNRERILDDSMIESRAARLLTEVTTYPDGAFAATLPEGRYDGGAVDVDVVCRTVPGLEHPRDDQHPVQVHVTRLPPNWSDAPWREISFEHSLPASIWCRVREMFGAWVICGRVIEHKTDKPVADAVVRAFDADLTQDDPLGTATTDLYGRFRIDYTADDFKRTPISPLVNIELIGGPDLYFQIESYIGTSLLDESQLKGRKPGRRNVSSCAFVELNVPAPAPMPPYDEAWEKLRKDEIESSVELGRTPIATDGDVYFRPFELLITPETFKALRTELTDRYGAELYCPNPQGKYWRSHYRGAPAKPLDINRKLQEAGIDLQLYVLTRDLDPNSMVKIVRTMRSRLSDAETDSCDDPGLGIHVNHVMFAEQFYRPGPDGFPFPSDPPSPSPDPASLSSSVDIAVLDTGVWSGWDSVHAGLKDNVQADNNDIDELDVTAPFDGLDSAAGHGFFIIGLIHRMYGGLVFDPGKVLTPTGDGDVASVAAELPGSTAPVINLSFGCHTDNNQAPPTIAQVITNLIHSGKVVVAAAGNNGTDRKFWPAAMPEVIAVGSWEENPTTHQRQKAASSNYGSWVDVYARGVGLISTYVNGHGFSGWARWSGTSFAAPQVAAEIASLARTSHNYQTVASGMLGALPVPDPAQWPWGGKVFTGVDLTQ